MRPAADGRGGQPVHPRPGHRPGQFLLRKIRRQRGMNPKGGGGMAIAFAGKPAPTETTNPL
ncbi:hypothetical protein EMIT0P201_10131 [Pseudomonas chlororaphis]